MANLVTSANDRQKKFIYFSFCNTNEQRRECRHFRLIRWKRHHRVITPVVW